jgi:hypothetical protein
MINTLQKSVSSLVMLSDGVLISGGGSEIKAWDSLMRFKLLRERVVSTQIVMTKSFFVGFLESA